MEKILSTIFSSLLFAGVLFATFFSLWRKLQSEHIDGLDKVFDRVIVSILIAMGISRVVYVGANVSSIRDIVPLLFSFSSFIVVGTVAVVAGLISLWLLLSDDWKDRFEILDYISIPLSLFFALYAVHTFIFSVLSLRSTGLSVDSVINITVPLLQTIVFGGLTFWLAKLELTYRTFLWYRYRRSSAQSGFVIAVFLIIFGLWGATFGWLSRSVIMIVGVPAEPILRMVVAVAGFVMIYIRSGRLQFPKH